MNVYVISDGSGHHKIGSAACVASRLDALQTGNPRKLSVSYTIESGNRRAVELRAHRLLAGRSRRGEWFDVPLADAISAITEAVEQERRGAPIPMANAFVRNPDTAIPGTTVRLTPEHRRQLESTRQRIGARSHMEALRWLIDKEAAK
jgi:hypothetical protein